MTTPCSCPICRGDMTSVHGRSVCTVCCFCPALQGPNALPLEESRTHDGGGIFNEQGRAV